MNPGKLKHFRILGIAPTTRGIGFAILEGRDTLVDWGVKIVHGNKNLQSLAKVKELITHYEPGLIVLEDISTKASRRSPRIKALSKKITTLAVAQGVSVESFSRERVRRTYFADGVGTKDALAEILAKRLPDELGLRLPPKRRAWMPQAYGMGIFDAVALALIPRLRNKRRAASPSRTS